MIKKLKPKSEFSRNVVTLMTGTTIAQAIPVAISPILTRIYTPEDFGVFALFVAIASIFGSIANGRYELAIMLPKKDEDAINIFALGLIITTVLSLTLFVLVILLNDYFIQLLNNSEIGLWLYFIPLSVFFTGIFNNLTYFNNRKKNYKDIANATIIKSVILSILQLSIGFVKTGASGLISGQIISMMFANLKLLKNIINNKVLISKINTLKIKAVAKRYKDFPKINLPHTIFSSISMSLPILVITFYFSTKEAGYFSLVSRTIMFPIGLISNAYYQVFFEAFSNEVNKEKFFWHKFKQINIIFIPIFLILWIIFPTLFTFVFGEEWKTAGSYAQVLLPLFYLKFISNLFTTTTYIYYEKQFENFILSIIIMITTLMSLLYGAYCESIILGLLLMSISNGMLIFFKLYRSFIFVKKEI